MSYTHFLSIYIVTCCESFHCKNCSISWILLHQYLGYGSLGNLIIITRKYCWIDIWKYLVDYFFSFIIWTWNFWKAIGVLWIVYCLHYVAASRQCHWDHCHCHQKHWKHDWLVMSSPQESLSIASSAFKLSSSQSNSLISRGSLWKVEGLCPT